MYAFNPNIYANATKNAVDEKSLGGSGGVAATAGNNEDSSQWPLNQSAYQNVANDQVDWAALAQRWIFMKETYPNADMPVAPPPPTISQREFEEQGEAPMEVEKEDEQHDDIFSQITASTQPSQDNNWQSSSDWQSGSQQGNNHWRKSKPGWNTWTNPNIVQNTQFVRAPLLPDPYSSNSSSGANSLDVSSDGYWQRLNNINTDSSNRNESNNSKNHVDSLPSPLDAARRKTLPAWIRQGLEKMEREKQKCAEREQQQAKSAATEQRILPDNVSYSELSSTLQSKSKFDDSDSESDDETLNDVKISHPQILLNNSASTVAASKPNFKSKNEQLQDLMLLVRGALTEILLEVTNEEIRNVATETLSKMRLKAKTAQTVRKTALSSLTGELGLGIYADSDNSGDSSSDESAGENVSNDNDSDYELQETIKRRKSSFEQKAKEIEAILAAEEEKEKSWLGQDDDNDVTGNVSVSGAEGGSSGGDSAGGKRVDSSRNNDKEFGEIQQEKNYLSHGRAKEKKASRFSDSKDIIKTIQIPQPSSTILPSHQSKSENVTVPKTPSSNHKDQNKKDSETSSNSSKNVVVKVEKSKRRNRSSSDDSEDSNNDDNGDDGDDDDDDDDDSSEDSYRSRKYSSHKRHRYDRSRSRSASSDRHHRRRRSSSRHKKSSRSDKRSHRDRESRESSRYSDRKRRSSRSYSKTSSSRHRSRSTRSRSASRSRSSKYSSHRHHHSTS